jgi:hypothetical protein
MRISSAVSGAMGVLAGVAHAALPAASAAAEKAAAAWLAELDSNDLKRAAADVAPEVLSALNKPTRDEDVGIVAMLLATDREDRGVRTIERHLQADSVHATSSCEACLVHEGQFVVLTYAVKYSWTWGHIPHFRQGTEVVTMLHESDGSWRLAGITLHLGGNQR